MIKKMTKYSFLLLSGETEDFLSSLQEIGLIDISRSRKPVDSETSGLYRRSEEIKDLIARIEKDDYSRCDEYPRLKNELAAAETVFSLCRPWGPFSGETVKKLEQAGCRLHFHSVEKKKFNPEWENDTPLAIINDEGDNVYFVTVSLPGLESSCPAREIVAPQMSCEQAEQCVSALKAQIDDLEKKLSAEKESIPGLKEERARCLDELQRSLADRSKRTAADDAIDVFVGFAPTEDDIEVQKALDNTGVFYLAEPATKEDNPPIKLKNNWFARNFETLTGMYGMPVYDEFDPTPVLAPFFMLFWAFCMGDSGYGLLLMGMALLLRKVDILGLSKHWRLVMTLGVGTTVIGLFLGTFFGISLTGVSWIPEGLKKLMIAGKMDVGGSSYDVQMIAALVIGVFHICLALVIKAVGLTRRFGFREAVSTWGWVVLIVGGISVAAGALCNVIDSDVTKWAVIALGTISFLGIFLFNKPGRNPLLNIGAGLWDTYGMVTGLLGDVLSYIRLYALGLAGGMLGSTFNMLGGMVLGSDPTWQWVPYVLILVAGHALNFALACLGAFVHPLRLTFVEYFKNSGYEGRGTEFNPLKKETIS